MASGFEKLVVDAVAPTETETRFNGHSMVGALKRVLVCSPRAACWHQHVPGRGYLSGRGPASAVGALHRDQRNNTPTSGTGPGGNLPEVHRNMLGGPG